MKIERTKNTIRNMSWGYIYRIISLVLPFGFRTVMLKVLGADYLGVNTLFTSVLQVLSLSELGFGSAMVFSMYKPIADSNDDKICSLLNYYKKVYLIIGCVILGVGIIIVPFIPKLISGSYPSDINIYFVYIMFLLNTSVSYFLYAYRGALINAYQRNDIESKILIIVSIVRYGIEIAGICLLKKYYLFLFVELGATVLQNLLKLITTKKMYPGLSPKGSIDAIEKNKIKDNVLALMCHKVGGVVLNSADNIVISAFMGVITVTEYGNYYYILNALESVVAIGFTGMTAGIGNSFITETVEKNRDNFKKILFFNGWIGCWCSACLACLYQDFMELWTGKQYMFNYEIVILFVVYFFVHCIRRTIIVFRDGAGMWKDNKWQPIVSAIFNIIVNIVLVNLIGVAGILLSSIASMILIDIPWETATFCGKLEMKRWEYIGYLIKYFVLTVVITIVTYFLTININVGLVYNLIIKALICILVPNFLLWVALKNKTEYNFYNALIRKIIKKN